MVENDVSDEEEEGDGGDAGESAAAAVAVLVEGCKEGDSTCERERGAVVAC